MNMNIDDDPNNVGEEQEEYDQISEFLKTTFPAKSNQELVKLLEEWAFIHADEREAYVQKHLKAAADLYVCSISGAFSEFLEEVFRICPPRFFGAADRRGILDALASILIEEINKIEETPANPPATEMKLDQPTCQRCGDRLATCLHIIVTIAPKPSSSSSRPSMKRQSRP